MSLGPKNSLLLLYEYFYKDATMYLKRNKDIFEMYRNIQFILNEWYKYNDDEQVYILQHARETLRDYNRLPDRVKG